ncbi:MAG: hypothetical protein Q8M24_23480 [Pseudolabrys sp.]|nr:hypothetical protein [Pseudolabrys sp.]
MPQAAKNITTDGEMTIGNAQKLFDAVPSALKHFQHHDHVGRKGDGRRTKFNDDDQEFRERIAESKVTEGRLEREYAKHGAPFTTDAKGNRVPLDWKAPFREERAQWNAAMEANAIGRKKIGVNNSDRLRSFCATTRRAYREVEMPNVADDRNPRVIVGERDGQLKEIEREELDVQNANRTDAEVEKVIRADCARRKKEGEPKFGDAMRGGSIRHNGEFTPSNLNARPQYQTAAATVHGDSGMFVEVDDALNFLMWADDEKILAKLLNAARAANAGKRQISEADKTTMLREIAVRKLAAQRHLEAAYRHAEAQGVEIKRRELPPEVLLWLELDTSAPAKPIKVQAVAPVEAADDIDFEDDAGDK